MSVTEQALAAATAKLQADLGSDLVLRNRLQPKELKDGQLVVLHDGDQIDNEEMIGMGVNHNHVDIEWQAELDVYFQAVDSAARSAGLDSLRDAAINSLIEDPTLGGVVDRVRAVPVSYDHNQEPSGGGNTVAVATVAVILEFGTHEPTW